MSLRTEEFYEFGPFRLDAVERRLLRDGETVALTAKAVEVLFALVENSGRTVSKEELLSTVWAESFVEEANLTVNISALRRALGEGPSEHRYIETVPRRGYRFVAAVHRISGGPAEAAAELLPPSLPPPSPAPARWVAGTVTLSVVAVVFALVAFPTSRGEAPVRSEDAGPRPPKAEARNAYLKGRFFWNKRSAAGLQKSIACFREAIELDADYALGYAGLADAYVFDLSDWPKAEEAARKAIELDPSIAEPHASLGFGLMFHRWDWEGAERELRQAVVLDPRYATTHQWYATWLAARGRLDEAKAQLEEAHRLEPLSLSVITDLAEVAYFEHDYDRSIARCREALDIDPDFVPARLQLARTYLIKQMEPDSFAERIRVLELTGHPPEQSAPLRAAFEREGLTGVLREETARFEAEPVSAAYAIAQNYAALGDHEGVLYWIRRAYEERNFYLLYMKVDPLFDQHRRDPRFQEVERLVGLSS